MNNNENKNKNNTSGRPTHSEVFDVVMGIYGAI